ncbi:MAG: hypothetical protein HUK15_07820 [Bacteroidales bacterium]|nr:hypothetical protein [Bacteroidales bacterium]
MLGCLLKLLIGILLLIAIVIFGGLLLGMIGCVFGDEAGYAIFCIACIIFTIACVVYIFNA